MSRRHLVDWACDRCGNGARVNAKSDTHLPKGWTKLKPPEGVELDLCGPCSAVWSSNFKAFFEEFVRNAFPRPVGQTQAFTPRAKNVLTLSVEEATRLNHHYVGTEHILLGLIREGEGIAAGWLQAQGVTLDKARGGIEFIVGKGSSAVTEDVVAEMDPETHPEVSE